MCYTGLCFLWVLSSRAKIENPQLLASVLPVVNTLVFSSVPLALKAGPVSA